MDLEDKPDISIADIPDDLLNKWQDITRVDFFMMNNILKKFYETFKFEEQKAFRVAHSLFEVKKFCIEYERRTGIKTYLYQSSKSIENSSSYNDKFKCCICFENYIDAVLIPCSHTLCHSCALKVDICPICKKNHEKVIQLFIP